MKTRSIVPWMASSMFVWACSGSDAGGGAVGAPDDAIVPPALGESAPASGDVEPGPSDDADAADMDAAVPAKPDTDAADGATQAPDTPTSPEVDAGACAMEIEPNDVDFHQLPRRLCGTLTATDVDRYYVEGRKDEPIEVRFTGGAEATIAFATNAGLSESFVGTSFTTTVKPGDRKLFIQVSGSSGVQAYRLAFDRR